LLGSAYTQIIVFGVVILSLSLLPNGILGRSAVKKV
jgi:branched-chain amino acid transport system permease protein